MSSSSDNIHANRNTLTGKDWHELVSCTIPVDRLSAEAAIRDVYAFLEMMPPEIVWVQSPFDCVLELARRFLHTGSERLITNGGSLFNRARGLMHRTLSDGPSSASLGLPLIFMLASAHRDALHLALKDAIPLVSDCLIFVRDRGFLSQHDTTWIWIATFDLADSHGVQKNVSDEVSSCMAIARAVHWWWPFERTCFLCERPAAIHITDEGMFHADGEPAVRYRDGYCIWAHDGVAVPQWLAETPADQIDPRCVMLCNRMPKIQEALVKKVGIARTCWAMDALNIEQQSTYQLLYLNLGDGNYQPYLRMRNPSTGEWHIEGVHPSCRTIEQALQWRNQADKPPAILR